MMRLIVGLGNVGEKYEKTRHNVGFIVIDELAKDIANSHWSNVERFKSLMIDNRDYVILSKPQTMMNSSGEAVSSIKNYYKIDENKIYVIHDDLDIKLGEYKIQKGKGPKEHKGLISIDEQLGSKDYWHVRVGVDNRSGEERIPGEDFVLMNFTDSDITILDGVIGKVVGELKSLIS